MSNTPKIDEILDQIQDRGIYELEGIDPETVAKAKQDLYQLILEIIGEDETLETATHNYGVMYDDARNDLKEEQRQKLSELFNITQ